MVRPATLKAVGNSGNSSENSIDAEILAAFFEDAQDVLDQWERFCLALKADGVAIAFEPLLRCAHNLKGSAGLVGFHLLHAKLHHLEDFLVHMRDKKLIATDEVVSVLLSTEKAIGQWIELLKKNPDPSLSVDMTELEEKLVKVTGHEVVAVEVPALLQPASPEVELDSADVTPEAAIHREAQKIDETVRVSAAKLDRLIQLVGEISLHQAILSRAVVENNLDSPGVRNVIDLKAKLTQDLQDASLGLRMIPVQGLFQKIERMARDTALREHKQVQVERIGDDVALDKLIVEGMVEPLIHIARNAVDHGLESAEDRVKSGKAAHGLIRIVAENTSTGVTLIFKDDGRGIDPERVFRKAVEKGLVDKDVEMTPNAKLQLIFMAGLSTAEKVTELSGRGVGMDVVADSVKRLSGQLEVQSEIGKGTSIVVTLPTNLSIIDALIVRVGGSLYAVPNRDLAEVIDLRDYRVNALDGDHERAIDLRGRVVPVAMINFFLSFQATDWADLTDGNSLTPRPAIVIHHGEQSIVLGVDAVVGQQQIFVRPLIGHLTSINYFAGSTILSDGEPCVILNVSEMARRYFVSH